MICQRMMVGSDESETWSFTVNTEAAGTGEKKTGIPFNLYGQDGVALNVDWGDGTSSTLTSDSYTDTDSRTSVHEYAEAGIYNIEISSNHWENVYFLTLPVSTKITSVSDINIPLYYMQRTLTHITSGIPLCAGRVTTAMTRDDNNLSLIFFDCEKLVSIPSELFSKNKNIISLNSAFYYCSSLASIPEGIFSENTEITDFGFLFNRSGVSSISDGIFDNNVKANIFTNVFSRTGINSIPDNIFRYNINATTFSQAFYASTGINDFAIRITSPNVGNAGNFCSEKQGTTRTIYVPSGSTTETTFNAVASSLGLTIIGE